MFYSFVLSRLCSLEGGKYVVYSANVDLFDIGVKHKDMFKARGPRFWTFRSPNCYSICYSLIISLEECSLTCSMDGFPFLCTKHVFS